MARARMRSGSCSIALLIATAKLYEYCIHGADLHPVSMTDVSDFGCT